MGAASSQPAGGVDPGGSSWRGWRGRTREWRAVTRLLRAAEAGRGGGLLVEGPSGIGKSRLLMETADVAAAWGFMIARGGADELLRLAPLAPLMSALGESAHTLGVPEGVAPSDTGDLRLWLVDQLRIRLEERLARGSMLLTLDDLQWADPTTLLALRSLLPELTSYPLVWILTRTSGFGDRGVVRLFETLAREGAGRIVLESLDDDAVSEVAVDVLGAAPDADLLALAAGAGGNPFLLVELLGGLSDEAAIELTGGHARLVSVRLPHLPQRVQAFARTRLDRLSPQTQQLLQVAAILGRSFSVDDLAEMLDEPSHLLPSLQEALAAQILVSAEETLVFRHDLLWQAVTEDVPAPLRRALHLQAGKILLKHGGSAVPAAAHFMSSAQPGDTRALAGLDQAAREVQPSSPQTAADLAVRALELTDIADITRFDRTVNAVYALTTAGRLSESATLARNGLHQSPPPHQAAHLRIELAYALLLAGRSAEALAEAEKALDQQDLPGELRGLAEQVLYEGWHDSYDYERGRERAEAIVAAGEDSSGPALVGAHMMLAGVAWTEGRAAEVNAHLREAVRFASGGPIQAQRLHPHPSMHLVTMLTDLRQFDEAETVLQAAEEEITALGHTAFAAGPAIVRAKLRLAEGRLDDAAVEAQAGLAIADEMGMHAFDLMGIAVLAIVAVCTGDIAAAAEHAQRYATRYQAGSGAMFGMAWGTWGMALVAEARDGPEKAIDLLHVPYTDSGERRWLLIAEPNAAPWLTRTALTVADRSTAETVTATAEHLANANPGFPTLAASAAHAHGILHRDPEALARAAATHLGPWSRASAAEDLGVLLASGDGDAAIHSLDQALDGYQRTGALRDAARVRARLRRLGVRRRHGSQAERPVSGWASLTDTEHNVATLVANGLTNRQVATQMFVSPHTINFHLRQIFRKLDIGSRVELARIATQHVEETAPHDT